VAEKRIFFFIPTILSLVQWCYGVSSTNMTIYWSWCKFNHCTATISEAQLTSEKDKFSKTEQLIGKIGKLAKTLSGETVAPPYSQILQYRKLTTAGFHH
jgi:hypothetical protein